MAKFIPIDILGSVIGRVLNRRDVPMNGADVPATAKKVSQAIADAVHSDGIAVVPVKSGWLSKINWLQLAGPVATIATAFGLTLTGDQIIAVFVVGQLAQSALTFVIKTWFTSSVTAASMVPPLTKE